MITPAPQLQAILDKVSQVELHALRALDSTRVGQFRSVFRGQGMEFDRVREYVPGDDIRHIDWNTTARTGRPHVKIHVEERDLCIIIAMDVSPSADFGTVGSTKREQLAELAAVLAFASLKGNDRVGLILFSDQVELAIPAAKGRAHVLQIVRAVLSHHPVGRGTAIKPALEHVQSLSRRHAVVFLLSDFYSQEPTEELDRALRVAALQHELVAVHTSDPMDEALPEVGVLTLQDSETGELVELDSSDPKVRARYAALARDRRQGLAERLRLADVDLLELSTARDYTPQLAAFFNSRGRRLR